MDSATAVTLGGSRGHKPSTSAPLDRLVFETGDLSKLPVVPHSLAVRRLLHADSNLLRGHVPGNVTHKDFIRKGESLRPKDVLEQTLRLKPVSVRPRPASAFGQDTALAEEALWREVQRAKAGIDRPRAGAAAGACGRQCGASPGPFAEPDQELAAEREREGVTGTASSSFATLGAPTPVGPPPHPVLVMESEGLRSGMAATGAFARILAQRNGAPTSSSPAPAHHFMSGGSRSQLRKEQRRAINQQRIKEANLDLRKEELVVRNLDLLQGIAEEEQQARERAEALMEFVEGAGAGRAGKAPAEAGTEGHPRSGGSSTSSAGFHQRSPPASPTTPAPKRFNPEVAAVGGVAVLMLAVALGLATAALAKRK
jgi:hypothetical protein